MIAVGCDHGGYDLKQEILRYLEERNIEYADYGCYSGNPLIIQCMREKWRKR